VNDSFSHSVIQSFSHSVIQWHNMETSRTSLPRNLQLLFSFCRRPGTGTNRSACPDMILCTDLRLNIRHCSCCSIFAASSSHFSPLTHSVLTHSLYTHTLTDHSHTHSHALKHTSYFRTVHQNILQNIHLNARTPEHHQSTRSNEQNSSRTTTEK
jgi:hypothetical protein